MAQTIFSKEEWLDGYESESSNHVANVAYNMFERFCAGDVEVKVKQYQEWFKVKDGERDGQSICQDLKRFTKFLGTDHPEIMLNANHSATPFKKKTPMTIRLYFSFIKSYLRQCHRIKLDSDDIKDAKVLPKRSKELRPPISLDALKKILFHASKTRRTLYCVLISSGMRLGEALALRMSDIHLDENPVRISIRKETTKTNEARETFISWEAVDMLKLIIEGKKENDRVFTHVKNNIKAVLNEEQYFCKLRERIGQKTPEMVEKYSAGENEEGEMTFSCRYKIHIHKFRQYFFTEASQKHGSDYAHGITGHGAYLKTYYELSNEKKVQKYKELEPNLLVEKYKPETEKTMAKKIENLEAEFQAYKERDKIIKSTLSSSF